MFKVGDKIEIVNSKNTYTVSTDGSIGTVTEVREYGNYKVKFTKLTGGDYSVPREYKNIQEQHMKKLGSKYKAPKEKDKMLAVIDSCNNLSLITDIKTINEDATIYTLKPYVRVEKKTIMKRTYVKKVKKLKRRKK